MAYEKAAVRRARMMREARAQREQQDRAQVAATREAAAQVGITLLGPPLESLQEGEYRRVAGEMARERVDGIIVGDQLENVTYGRLIVSLAHNARLPMVFPYREYFEIGGLMAYGPSLADVYRSRWVRRPHLEREATGRDANLLGL